ncbi:hypothetical protein CFP71_32410 [Amycolatopsis thailandensis]|uniref:Uncharacterized protein n=1 Tax=Amycolatopsis thailandensis TaxID=589330 RepID=A0A229RPS4_9PSEU|nr:hypothetical protein [Amycolatopsis thailandensis]OXM48471.1 hypothetical protein CFP71_32410 [Amycolatopsis thailandensis]
MSSDAEQATAVAVAATEPAAPAVPEPKADNETSAAPATEAAAAGAVPPVVDAGTDVEASPPGRMSKPVIVAAAVAGVVLVALPLAFSGLLGGDQSGEGPEAAGYAKDLPPGGGFVPGLAAPPADKGGVPAGQPGNQLPGQAADGVPAGQAGAPAEPGTAGLPGGPPPAAGGGPAQAPQQHQGQPPAQQPQGPPAPPAARTVTYEGTAGRGCGGGTGFTGYGAYSDGKAGWVNHGNGGCGTSFVSIPMSGDANKDDTSAYGLWTFNTGPVTTGSCAVSVFVPNGDVTEVGGSPSVYRVFDRFAVDKGTPVGTFQIDQVGNRGRWVNVGTFRINGAKLAVQLLNRGRDWSGSSKTYAHHAAATVKANCQA